MQYAKGIDPTMAVYAAYAYYDLQTVTRIEQMSGSREDLGVSLFDVDLLARQLVGRQVTIDSGSSRSFHSCPRAGTC